MRPLYSTDNYKKEGNNGPEYRTIHLGVDFFIPSASPIHAFIDGTVVSLYRSNNDKDYGNVLILHHLTDDGIPFYTLYGHLSNKSLTILNVGDTVKKGSFDGLYRKAGRKW